MRSRAALMLILPTALLGPVATAGELAHDSGNLQTVYTVEGSGWGMFFAVKFHNAAETPVGIRTVKIAGGDPDLEGGLDVFLWDEDWEGKPDYWALAELLGQTLDPGQTWNAYPMWDQAEQVVVLPGYNVFAGFGLADTSPCGVPYDDQHPGAGKSWWQDPYQTWDWERGGPPAADGANLMVRVDVTPLNYWKGNTGDWFDDDNWWYGVPQADQEVKIDAGTVQISAGAAVAASVILNSDLQQTGGQLSVGQNLFIGYWYEEGTYAISSGALDVARLYVGHLGAGTLAVTDPACHVAVSEAMHLRLGGRVLSAGGTIHMTGADLINESTTPQDLADLANVTFIFEGGPETIDTIEVAGTDFGPNAGGWSGNFALGTIQLGGAAAGRVRLVDEIDNQPAVTGSEALYVGELILNPAAAIDLNGLKLYYLNGGEPKEFFCGDATLDGKVDYVDLGILATHYDGSGKAWADGDFTGDGTVDYVDLGILATYYDSGVAAAAGIPEPAVLTLLPPAAAMLAGRKRRRRT